MMDLKQAACKHVACIEPSYLEKYCPETTPETIVRVAPWLDARYANSHFPSDGTLIILLNAARLEPRSGSVNLD
jgi:hypothetical protein